MTHLLNKLLFHFGVHHHSGLQLRHFLELRIRHNLVLSLPRPFGQDVKQLVFTLGPRPRQQCSPSALDLFDSQPETQNKR